VEPEGRDVDHPPQSKASSAMSLGDLYLYSYKIGWCHGHKIQDGAQRNDTFWHMISYTKERGGMECANCMYKVSNLLLIYYFWWMTYWEWHSSFATHSLEWYTKLSKAQRKSSWFMVADSSWIASFSFCIVCVYVCVCVRERERLLYKHSFKLAHRKKSGTVRSAKLQAMGYPIHENAFRPSLRRHILHRSIVTELVLKRHDITSFSVCRHYPLTPFVRQKCVVKRVNRLHTTLYNAIASIWSVGRVAC
jgi:hypothetical protein